MEVIKGLPPVTPSIEEIGGVIWPAADLTPESSYNPSIAYSPSNGYAMLVRKSNYKLDNSKGHLSVPSGARGVRNIVGFSKLDENLIPIAWVKVNFLGGPVQKRGVEDGRLFSRKNEWYFHAVMMESHTPYARTSLWKLDEDGTAHYIETYNGVDDKTPEKNWMTEMYREDSDISYVKRNPNGLRGGSCLVSHGDGYIAILHKTYKKSLNYYNSMTFGYSHGEVRNYTHVFAFYDKNKNLVSTSKEFTFRPIGGIEFASGLIKHNDEYVVSFGVDDMSSWFAKIKIETVEKLIKDEK
jgi:predicted GH43/DUF377 family glycosyl hydrolase